eukprot:NODE_512_length_6656_cov_0.587006.p4 type:complete len:183 gc:universal NODE_512_length_6656_cov_0.587006:6162-5614(-)
MCINAKDADVMEPIDYIPPSDYNVLLIDVKHNDLVGRIADQLNVKYLDTVHNPVFKPSVSGILFGSNARPMINLVVASKKHKKWVNIIFLVDTGCPNLYVCDLAMKKLGFSDHIPKTFKLLFGDYTLDASMSPLYIGEVEGHYKEINLIGASFLLKMAATLTIDYKSESCSLFFPHFQSLNT